MADPTHPEALEPWPEDTVEYRVYCDTESTADDARMSEFAVECNYAARQLSGRHVWHYAPFALWPGMKGIFLRY